MESRSTSKGDSRFDSWVSSTRLFRDWEETKREILVHKWYESEKAGHDIGWERAAVDWLIRFGHKKPKTPQGR